MLSLAPQTAQAFDLNGADATLPQPGNFDNRSFLNGAENVTNSGGTDATLTEGGGASGTIYSGIISDGATNRTAIIHTGGAVTFTGNSSYTGGTSLFGGTLILGNNNALGTGAVSAFSGTTIGLLNGINVSNNLTVDVSQTFNVGAGFTGIYSGVISEFGDPTTLTITGGGTLVLTNSANDFNGGLELRQGTVRYDNVAAIDTGTLLFTGGILQAGTSGTLANLSAFFDVSGATIDTQAFDVTLDAVIANSGAPTGTFVKLGSGTLTLTNSGNSYSTATLVSAGTLAGDNANVFGNNSAVTVAGGAVLDLGGFDQAIGSLSGAGTVTNSGATPAELTAGGDNTSTVFSGVIEDGLTNATSLLKTGTGTLTLTGDNTYLGGTTISVGTLQLGDGGTSGSIVGEVVNNGALIVNRSDALTMTGNISGTGALTKIGAGTLILDGFNDYSGATNILQGGILATDDFALSENSAFRVNKGASLELDGGVNAAIGSLADGPLGGGLVMIGAANPSTFLHIGLDDKDTTFSGVITGAGSLEKIGAGIQTLTGKGSSIGGVLEVCDCTGNGGLDIAGGSFKAGLAVFVLDSLLSVTKGGLLEQTNPFGILNLDAGKLLVDGAGSKVVVSGLTRIDGFAGDAALVIQNGGKMESKGGADVAGVRRQMQRRRL